MFPSMRKMAEDMDEEKERKEFLAMAEEIDRPEDDGFEQQKLIILSDYRKRLGNKNYPDLGLSISLCKWFFRSFTKQAFCLQKLC